MVPERIFSPCLAASTHVFDQRQVMRCISSCTAGEGIQHSCFVQWCVMVEDHMSICLNPVAVLQRQRVGCPCDCMSENVLFVMTLLCCSGD